MAAPLSDRQVAIQADLRPGVTTGVRCDVRPESRGASSCRIQPIDGWLCGD